MEFCEVCENMYYMKVDDNDEENPGNLVFYCKCCGHVDKNIDTKNLKVSKFTKNSKTQDININEYTKFDPTLPHVSSIKCPNASCKSNTSDVEQDVIYLRYDDKNMKYLYICYHCDYSWKP